MINTQPMLSQFHHLTNGSTGTKNHYLSDKRQQILHKHSQSLDANGPYIAISECHSGKSFMQKQLKSSFNQQQSNNSCSLGQDHLNTVNKVKTTNNLSNSINQISIYNNRQQLNIKPNCESKLVLHTRSSSNIVLGSKKQYGQQQLNNYHLNHLNSSTICPSSNATGNLQKLSFLSDKPTNRHFKIYEKNELSNSTSLNDLSTNLSTLKCNCSFNKNLRNDFNNTGSNWLVNSNSNLNYSSNYSSNLSSNPFGNSQLNPNATYLRPTNQSNLNYLQRSINTKQWNTSLLNEKFDNLSLNCTNQAPPRPPKPDKLRISNQFTDQLNSTTNSLNNNSFNESFPNSFMVSSDEYSPTSTKPYGSYYQFNANQRPKNSLSSSCSSNVSPFYNSSNSNAQDLVFVYDQNMGNYQTFPHSSSSRLNSFEDTSDVSDNSPTYLNKFDLNNSNLINLSNNLSQISNQTSPKSNVTQYNLAKPPIVNRDLKPRKNLNNNQSSNSYYQANALRNVNLISDLEELYNNVSF